MKEGINKAYIYKTTNVLGMTKTFVVAAPLCLVCVHCDDIIQDFTGVPYHVHCELNKDEDKSKECTSFKVREGIITLEEYSKLLKEEEKSN